jgi:hypothetical protein
MLSYLARQSVFFYPLSMSLAVVAAAPLAQPDKNGPAHDGL